MKRFAFAASVLVLLAVPTLLPARHQLHASGIEWNETVASLVDSVSETSFIATIQTLEDLETRHSSLSNYLLACNILIAELQSYGYQPMLQSFKIEWGSDSVECWNLVVEKEGVLNPDNVYIICSHLDSTTGDIYNAPGADDNASGTAAVMEAARVMAGTDFENTVRFVCFGGEEQGLVGSFYYVEQAYSAGENLCGTINMDMILYAPVGSDSLRIRTDPPSMGLASLYQDCALTYVPDLKTRIVLYRISDYYAFWVYGYPALGLIEETLSPYIHSSSDQLANYMAYFPFGTNTTRASVAALATLAVPVGYSIPDTESIPAGNPGLVVSPNPTRGPTTLSFSLVQDSYVELQILDLQGRLVQVPVLGWLAGGSHQAFIDQLTPGIYFCRMLSDGFEATVRFVVIR